MIHTYFGLIAVNVAFSDYILIIFSCFRKTTIVVIDKEKQRLWPKIKETFIVSLVIIW